MTPSPCPLALVPSTSSTRSSRPTAGSPTTSLTARRSTLAPSGDSWDFGVQPGRTLRPGSVRLVPGLQRRGGLRAGRVPLGDGENHRPAAKVFRKHRYWFLGGSVWNIISCPSSTPSPGFCVRMAVEMTEVAGSGERILPSTRVRDEIQDRRVLR